MHLKVKDYTVTNEIFQILKCKNCKFLLTDPRPSTAEISRYYQSDKYISHTGGGSSFLDKVYLFARKFTLRWKYETITRYRIRGSILDFGCGTGEFLNHCQQFGWEVRGVERSDVARTKAAQLTGKNIAATMSDLDVTQHDVITLWHVLEHLHALPISLKTLARQLKPTGTMFIAVPNYTSADGKHYQQYWAGYDVPRHLWHFSSETMSVLLKQVGLKIVAIKPMKLDAFYISLLSESYRHPNRPKWLIAVNAVFRGLHSNLVASKTKKHSSVLYIAKHA
ncbi:MAG: class I SAM-dependent methyltransferase [Cytophagales bacterium]